MQTQKHYPIVLNEENKAKGTTRRVPIASSAALYFGSFFDPYTGTNGAQAFAANQKVRGVVTDILTYINGAYVSVAEVVAKGGTVPGTYAHPTTVLNAKYTAPSGNVTKAFPDVAVFEEITISDKVEAVLGDAGVPVPRGTTAASNVLGSYLEPDPTYPWMLIESGVNAAATGLNFQIVERSNNVNKVIIKLINADGAVS